MISHIAVPRSRVMTFHVFARLNTHVTRIREGLGVHFPRQAMLVEFAKYVVAGDNPRASPSPASKGVLSAPGREPQIIEQRSRFIGEIVGSDPIDVAQPAQPRHP